MIDIFQAIKGNIDENRDVVLGSANSLSPLDERIYRCTGYCLSASLLSPLDESLIKYSNKRINKDILMYIRILFSVSKPHYLPLIKVCLPANQILQ